MSLAKIGNKIFNKEVELSRESVELGIVQDVSKLNGAIKSTLKEIWNANAKAMPLMKKAKALEEQYASALKVAKSENKKLEKATNNVDNLDGQIDKMFAKVKKLAEELGVTWQDVEGMKELDDLQEELLESRRESNMIRFINKDKF